MPKMKTRSAAVKRFKVTAKKKIFHQKAGMSHLLEHESANIKRGRRNNSQLSKEFTAKVKRMLAI